MRRQEDCDVFVSPLNPKFSLIGQLLQHSHLMGCEPLQFLVGSCHLRTKHYSYASYRSCLEPEGKSLGNRCFLYSIPGLRLSRGSKEQRQETANLVRFLAL